MKGYKMDKITKETTVYRIEEYVSDLYPDMADKLINAIELLDNHVNLPLYIHVFKQALIDLM